MGKDRGVPGNDERLRQQYAGCVATEKSSVPPQEVPTSKAALVALPGGPVRGGGRANVHRNSISRCGGGPAGGAQTQGDVDVLAIKKNTLVETPHFFPCRTTVCTARTGWADEDRILILSTANARSTQPGISSESRIDGQAEALDAFFAGGEQECGDRAEALVVVEGLDQVLEKVGPAIDVVVEKHDDLTGTCASPAVAGHGEAEVGAELEHADIRKHPPQPLGCSIGRPVVCDHDGVDNGLCPEMFEAAPR